MGKTLIAYASKSGTAKEAAGRIAEMLPGSDLVDLTAKIPILSDYEAAIIGGGVRIGAVHKETKRFIDANTAKLETMRTAYFITNSFVDDADEIIGKMLPDNLRRQAVFTGTLGGRLDIDNLKGLDKKIAKMVSKSLDEGTRVATGLDEDALEALISQFR
jgi:menaquinone-dependent protoporphyrinogen IX oxidase